MYLTKFHKCFEWKTTCLLAYFKIRILWTQSVTYPHSLDKGSSIVMSCKFCVELAFMAGLINFKISAVCCRQAELDIGRYLLDEVSRKYISQQHSPLISCWWCLHKSIGSMKPAMTGTCTHLPVSFRVVATRRLHRVRYEAGWPSFLPAHIPSNCRDLVSRASVLHRVIKNS